MRGRVGRKAPACAPALTRGSVSGWRPHATDQESELAEVEDGFDSLTAKMDAASAAAFKFSWKEAEPPVRLKRVDVPWSSFRDAAPVESAGGKPDPHKNDVFCLGACFLYAATLEPPERWIGSDAAIRKRLEMVAAERSPLLNEGLRAMLVWDPARRPTFKDIQCLTAKEAESRLASGQGLDRGGCVVS
eukprot:Polyplicarium_translucidae@DN1365_c0_g1_i3.p2